MNSFLYSPTFSRIVNSLSFEEAMNFLEAFIIKNEKIPDDTKVELFSQKELLVYDFMGELTSLGSGTNNFNNDNSSNQERSGDDKYFHPHIRHLYDKLTKADIERIKSSKVAMKKLEELRKTVDEMEDSAEQDELFEMLDEFIEESEEGEEEYDDEDE